MEDNCLFCRIVSGEAAGDDRLRRRKFSRVSRSSSVVSRSYVISSARTRRNTRRAYRQKSWVRIFEAAQLLSRAVESAMEAEGTFVAMNNRVSQSVPHLHVHVVPRRKKDGLKGFFWPRTKYKSDEEMEEVKKKIADALKKIAKNLQK